MEGNDQIAPAGIVVVVPEVPPFDTDDNTRRMRRLLVTGEILVMNGHGGSKQLNNDESHCVADGFLKFFSQEWMSHVVLALARHGPLRFGALRRQLPPRISARVLSARLKALEAAGYVERRDLSGRVLHVEYSLTATGRAVDATLARSEQLVSDGAG